ncbi:MAG: hypothetical protein HZC29_05505 [Thaumarchaeota archaeon]|nr:hypothetical protein [Nitrososphaerota archaeon]
MIRLHKKESVITTEILVNTVWVSTFLALILTLPALGVFLGVYFTTSNLLAGAIIGFGVGKGIGRVLDYINDYISQHHPH